MSKLLKTKRLIWGLICVVVTAVAIISYYSGVRYLAAVAAVEHTLAVGSAIDGSLSLLKDGETGQRGFMLTGDERFLEPYQLEQNGIAASLAELRRATEAAPVQLRRLSSLEQLISEKHAFMDQTLRLRREGRLQAALELIRGGDGKRLMDEIRAVFRQLRDYEHAVLAARKQEAKAAQAAAVWGVGLGSLITLLLAFSSLLAVHRELLESKRTSEELAQREEHFRLLTEHGSDLVRLIDLRGGAAYVSPSVEHLLGYGVEEFLALSPLVLVHPDDLASARQFLVDVQSGAALPDVLTYRLRHKSGEYRYFETRWVARRDARGQVTQLQTAARDVTDRKRVDEQLNALTQELRSLSLRDELTGLYNRRGFLEIAGQTRDLAARDGRAAALIFIDLNGMKGINDQFGHDAGDAALLDATRVLLSAHGEGDVVARLGGDEFAVFCIDFRPWHLEPLRLRFRELADAEVAQRGRVYRLSLSAGAAYLEPGSQESIGELLRRADAAMYEQKSSRVVADGITLVPPSGIESRTGSGHARFR